MEQIYGRDRAIKVCGRCGDYCTFTRGHKVCLTCEPEKAPGFKKLTRRQKILGRDSHTCHYCGAYADEVDHKIPKDKGGDDSEGNLVAACFDCNKQKGVLMYDEFLLILKRRQGITCGQLCG